MNLAVFGLSLTISWGNGHTTYRGLLAALARRGWTVTFVERDLPWYREHRAFPAAIARAGRPVLR